MTPSTPWLPNDSTYQIAESIGRSIVPRETKGKYPCLSPAFSAHSQLWHRCRSCKHCQLVRQWNWFYRAWEEIWTSQRTWFVTLTLRPGKEHTRYDEIQKMIKRFRKEFQNTQRGHIRYLFVNDYGKQATQRRHYHGLIHCNEDLRKDDLLDHWPHGFDTAVLLKAHNPRYAKRMDTKEIDWNSETFERTRYCAAYCGKGNKGRIRASSGYGRGYPLHKVGIVCTITGLDIPF